MPDIPPSPPKGISASPSIFAYQTRILQGSSSTTNVHRRTPGSSSTGLTSLAALANASPPSTPIRQHVAKMVSNRDVPGGGKEVGMKPSHSGRVGLGLGMGGRPDSSHGKGSKSVDLVRGQWEAKINDATALDNPGIPRSSKRGSLFSPPLETSSSMSSVLASPPVRTPSSISTYSPAMTPDQTGSSISTAGSTQAEPYTHGGDSISFTTERTPKRSTAATPYEYEHKFDASSSSSSIGSSVVDVQHDTVKQRPPSAASILSPNSTGSSAASKHEDTLAVARANALRRAEERRKAKAKLEGRGEEPSIVPVVVPVTPQKVVGTPKTSSPFDHLFSPPTASEYTPTTLKTTFSADITPTSSHNRSSYRNIVTPPSADFATSRYVPSGLTSANTPVSSSAGSSSGLGASAGKDKYGSISKTDRRRLGRHLPRIASGGEGWEDEESGTLKPVQGERKSSSLGRAAIAPESPSAELSFNGQKTDSVRSTTTTPSSRPRAAEVLTPSRTENRQVETAILPTTPASKRRSAYLVPTPKAADVLRGARPEVAGEEMKGLMNDVGALSVRGGGTDDSEGVTGMSNRLRLTRKTLPPSASSSTMAPAPLPSRRLMQTNWMDRQRHAIAAYEYLCHVGEAQQWIEGCIDEELGFGVTEMEDGLSDGVVLAKLARVFRGEGVVKKIWTDKKFRYKQTDNINHFLEFLKSAGMPHTFTFDPIDLYEKKNFPKVVFCIHVLSHLLARQGLAERIGNLVGHFEFTDEQLAKTQKGLQGVAMPNFGDARKTLAKEASWVEPEEPEETEDERRDRELLECEASIINLQRSLRGRLARMRISRIDTQLKLAEPIIARFQARSRGAITRRALLAERDQRAHLDGFATALQAAARAHISSKRWDARIVAVHAAERSMIGVQSQARGMLARVRRSATQNALDKSYRNIVALQAVCRGCLGRRARQVHRKALIQPQTVQSVTSLQAVLRGKLLRQAESRQMRVVEAQSATFTSMQSQIRGAMVRRNRKAHEEKMEDATDYVVAIQATARGVLARRKKQIFVKAVQHSMPALRGLQAIARARLARQAHHSMQKALAKVEVAGSVGGLQAFLRTKLAKRQTTEQKKKLEFVQPDVIGFQAVARGYLARQEYREWREYLQDPHTQGALVFLQSLIRGFLARRRLWIRTSHIHRNVDKVVKIQAVWRGRIQRQMYDRLLTGIDVDVSTIQNYMHLLDDTEADYQRQIHTETLRREVAKLIRENQGLETEVKELDTKIALILKNKMTFEELARARHSFGHHTTKDDGVFKHEGNRDPFTSGAHLDRASQRKLELFEHLFFTLQTKGEYLSRLLSSLSKNEENEKDRRLVEGVTLTLFGFGHERREDYLFHKLLQLAVHEEILKSKSLAELAESRFAITSVAAQYIRPALTPCLQEALADNVMRVVDAHELDLTTDPGEIYRRLINEEESRTGIPSTKDRNLDGNQVLQTDEHARALYIQHLQELRHLTKQLLETLMRFTPQLPYTVRLLAREALLAMRVKYRDTPDQELIPIVARTVILPFILPAIIAPEPFGIASEGVGAVERRNLAAIANLITHVAAQDFTNSVKDWFVRTPLQEYIRSDGRPFADWIMDVASVDPLEAFFQAHELFESTSEATPIQITRTEIYGMLGIMMKHSKALTAGKPKDPIGIVLTELEGPPVDFDRGKQTVSLRLTNRLAELQGNGTDVQQKEDWVQAKRHVLAVLRVQTGFTLYDILVARPEEIHEQAWLEEVYRDMALEQAKKAKHHLPPTQAETEYQIESIRSLPFHEVKSRAIEFCMKLERSGKLSRHDNFQGLLVSIAGDIRQKHHLRKMQRQNAVAMEQAHEDMSRKHRKFEEQISSYHEFIDSSMASLQKGKKKPTFLSKQYFHQRNEAKSGKKSKFGSYKYTAQDLYTRGILLGISQFSPTQFSDIYIIMSSNEVGVFSLEMVSSLSSGTSTPGSSVMGREAIRMEDLLQAQFENEQNLAMFGGGQATFSINMLIHQINKKFYAT